MTQDRYWPASCPNCDRDDSIRIDGRGSWLCAACGCWQTEDDDEPQGLDGVNWPTHDGEKR